MICSSASSLSTECELYLSSFMIDESAANGCVTNVLHFGEVCAMIFVWTLDFAHREGGLRERDGDLILVQQHVLRVRALPDAAAPGGHRDGKVAGDGRRPEAVEVEARLQPFVFEVYVSIC